MKKNLSIFILLAMLVSLCACAAEKPQSNVSPYAPDTLSTGVNPENKEQAVETEAVAIETEAVAIESEAVAIETEAVAIETENPYAYPPEDEYTEIVLRDERYFLCKKVVSGFSENGEYYGIYDSLTGTWPLAYAEYDTYDMNYLEFYSHGNGVFSYKYSYYYGSMMFLSAELGGSFKTDKIYNYKNVKFIDGKALATFYIGSQGYVDGRIASDTELAWVDTMGNISTVSIPGFSDDDMFYWSESYLTGWGDSDQIFAQSFYNYNTGERLHYVYVYFYEDDSTTIISDQYYTTRLREYVGDVSESSDITVEGNLIRITNLEGDDGKLYYAEFDRAGNVVTEATPMY